MRAAAIGPAPADIRGFLRGFPVARTLAPWSPWVIARRCSISKTLAVAGFRFKPSTLYADLAVAPESCQFVGPPSAKAKATAWIVGLSGRH